ncbi:rod shape determining protein RodA [Caloranaerobacter azorensis DSM 13643]|uniref:Peptidoglycan glycosyltransferase RodA n=1 Tax=Caloranaerobacter azorensis DSM 13643 TaxID=1121264 RepID=A0A1M5W8H4_9FIRM|nr:rod shape-determining protein RodA [Caloranaerobacter azorensis]SHH83771.1 rod shape determining protein RodA [Caloranaerobacter azorensis DSM 13643]
MLERKLWKKFDYILFITIILLCIYGFIVIASATSKTKGSDIQLDINFLKQLIKNPFLKTQITSFVLGLIAIFILALLNYETFGRLYLLIYGFCNLLLIAVLLFGTGEETWGAKSWLSIGGFSFQPSEIVKIGIIISVAKFIDNNKEKINEPFTLLKILMFSLAPVALILMQPDFGTATVFMFFIFIMLFIAGLNIKYILYAVGAGLISLPVLWLFLLKGYQKDRIRVFLDPSLDAMGAGYQVIQSKIAIGSGKILGRGLFHGVQTQYGFLPEKHTDFIFAVIGEELGLIGGLVLLLLYFIMLYRLIIIAKNSKDLTGSLIVIGIAAMISFHIIENIGMTMGLMPVTGIPLPFISYGGTFLLANLISIGLVLSIGMRKDKLNF